MNRLMAGVVLFLGSLCAQAQCYVNVGVGQSAIKVLTAAEIERDIFETEFSSGEYREDRRSTTGEVHVGCVVYESFATVKAEIGAFDGFKHVVDTTATVSYGGYSAQFDVERVIRARGYLLSGIAEFPVYDDWYLYGRLGVAYVTIEGDVRAFEYPYSLHARKTDFVPVVGIGGRYALSDEWSLLLEYRAVGHYDVQHAVFLVQYSF